MGKLKRKDGTIQEVIVGDVNIEARALRRVIKRLQGEIEVQNIEILTLRNYINSPRRTFIEKEFENYQEEIKGEFKFPAKQNVKQANQ